MKSVINKSKVILISLLLVSCTQEEVETTAKVLALTYLFSISYSHQNNGYHYYKTNNCSSNYNYYNGTTHIHTYCRYYSDYNGYYVSTTNRYSSINVYR